MSFADGERAQEMLKSRLRKLVQGYPNRSTSCTLARAEMRTKLLSPQAKSGRIARGFGDRVSTSRRRANNAI